MLTIFWHGSKWNYPLESRLRFAEVMSGLFPAERVILGAPEASKLAKWPILTILPRLTLSWPFFLLELGWTHPRNSWLGCAEVLPGLIPVKKGILGLLWPSKRPKIANFGHFNSFDAKKLNFTWPGPELDNSLIIRTHLFTIIKSGNLRITHLSLVC